MCLLFYIYTLFYLNRCKDCASKKNKFPDEKSSLLRDIIFLLIPLLSSKGPLMGPSYLGVASKGPLNDLLGTSK